MPENSPTVGDVYAHYCQLSPPDQRRFRALLKGPRADLSVRGWWMSFEDTATTLGCQKPWVSKLAKSKRLLTNGEPYGRCQVRTDTIIAELVRKMREEIRRLRRWYKKPAECKLAIAALDHYQSLIRSLGDQFCEFRRGGGPENPA
jgi:hypothetical protein